MDSAPKQSSVDEVNVKLDYAVDSSIQGNKTSKPKQRLATD